MDRRKSIKALVVGSASAGLLIDACKLPDKKTTADDKKADGATTNNLDRQPEDLLRDDKSKGEKYFTEHEMATIAILADIIIPKDEVSGSATEAGVPEFIEFIVKDMPNHQTPMRGGLRWLDIQTTKQFGKLFSDLSAADRIKMVDQIAYPKKAKPEMQQGVSFFNLMRNLTATGFYTSRIGVADLGYKGNTPNKWKGVPDDVLQQYGMAYTEKELRECI